MKYNDNPSHFIPGVFYPNESFESYALRRKAYYKHIGQPSKACNMEFDSKVDAWVKFQVNNIYINIKGTTMKVFLLYMQNSFWGEHLVGVFATRELAEARARKSVNSIFVRIDAYYVEGEE